MRSAPAKVVLVILATTLTGCVTGLPEAEVADLYFKLGSAYFELGQYDNSVSSYSQALSDMMGVARFRLWSPNVIRSLKRIPKPSFAESNFTSRLQGSTSANSTNSHSS